MVRPGPPAPARATPTATGNIRSGSINGNPYFTAAENAALFPAGTTAVDIARFNNDLSRQLNVKQSTNTEAVSAGLKGKTFGDFTWDVHYTHGQNAVTLLTINNMNTARFYAAIDAVTDPATGNTVCRTSITAPGAFPGCQPLNILGQNNSTTAAQQYVFGNTWWQAKNKMDDFTANLTGTVFEGWAGPIKTAVGFEYRHQALKVITSEPNGVTFNPQGLRLAPDGTYGSAGTINCGNPAAGDQLGSFPSSDLAWFKEVQSGGAGRGRHHRGRYRAGCAPAEGPAVRPTGLPERRLSLHDLFDQRSGPCRTRVLHLLGQHLQDRPGMDGE